MPEDHPYSALSLKTLLSVLLVLVLVAGAAAGWYLWRAPQAPDQQAALISSGTELWNAGKMEEARAAFEAAKRRTNDPREQAQLDIYITATFARQNPQQTVENYLAIINNESYPRDARSFAGALLLTYIQNTSDESLTTYVFARAPFAGLYSSESESTLINREVAYSRAHHLLLSTYGPNFLSYLTAGSIYSYLYPHVDASVQAIIGPRIPEYFTRGRTFLNEAIANRSTHSSINALGLRTLATFTDDYQRLVSTGVLADIGAPDAAAVAGEYRRALDYAFATGNHVEPIIKFTTTLRYAAFMQRSETASSQELQPLAGYVTALLDDASVRRLIRQSGDATIEIGPFAAYRTALRTLAEIDPALRTALEQGSWDAADLGDE